MRHSQNYRSPPADIRYAGVLVLISALTVLAFLVAGVRWLAGCS